MPVPRPGQCSHRIKVTQRTRFIEVTAKVDIVTNQETVPTAIHSYTSGIGISLLSLPLHIQRLAGDTTSLPTRLPFDLYEPVYLIISTYRPVLFGVVYHGWVLATNDDINLPRGGGPDDGIQSLMTSYRSELRGLVAGLEVLGALFRAGTINIRSV
jgi:hypothetical protein